MENLMLFLLTLLILFCFEAATEQHGRCYRERATFGKESPFEASRIYAVCAMISNAIRENKIGYTRNHSHKSVLIDLTQRLS